jgi:large subunit ribosomal protein L24
MLYSEKEKVASRVGYTFTEDGRKVRMLKKTGEIIDK